MSYTGIIKIPVLFDMSGDTIVYGEDVTGDFVTSHLDFILDMTTEANDISLNAADISAAILVGDQDNTDNLFYSGGSDGTAIDNLCNRISKAITRGKLVHIPKAGNHSNSGIPLGGRTELVDATGTHTIYHIQNVYTPKYFTTVAPIGDEQMLGEAMARVASIHLVGTPLAAAAFEDAASIQTSLEVASGQTFNSGNTAFYNALAVQLSKVLGGSKSSAPMNNGSGSSGGGGGGSNPDLASQVLYEDFEDNAYTGDVTTATIVSGGYNSSDYALQGGGKNNYNRWRINAITYQSVSFWYYRDSANSGNNVITVFDNGRNTNGTNVLYINNQSGGANQGKIGFWSSTSAVTKLYINGVDQSSAVTTGYSGYTPITYADLTWHHFYFEFSSATNMPFCVAQPDNGTSLYSAQSQYIQWGGGGKFDEVRLFNTALSTPQITDLAAGNNGGGGGNIILPSDVALINMDGTTHSRERGDIANIIDNDDTTWSYTTIAFSADSHAPFITKFSFPTQQVGKRLNGVLFKTSTTDNHTMAGLKFGILNGTTYTSLNVTSGTNLGTGSSLTTGTVTWNNDTNWHIETYPVDQNSQVNFNDYTIQSNDHLVVRWSAATTHKHFTLRYFKFLIIEPPSSGGGGGGYPLDASGTSVPALKSIYEQLMSVPGRSQIMQTRDISGVVDNSNTTLAGGFPFITGDKLVMYLRPKIVFAAQTKAEQATSLVGFSDGVTLNTPAFNVGRIGQGINGQTYDHSDVYPSGNNDYIGAKAFEGTITGGYGWLANDPFDNTTGAYNTNPPSNTSVDGVNLAGSWIQVNIGKKAAVTSYKIYPQDWEKPSIGGRSPHIFKLVYSDDGTNFLTADSQTVGTSNTDTSEWATTNDGNATYIPKTFTLTTTKIGQYWRLIITSVYGNSLSNGGALAVQELEINGSDDYSGSGDSGGVDLSGLQTNIVATAENIEDAFPGNATTGPEPEMNKWGWMGSPNSDSLTLESTDVTDIRTIDLHIWKITITL
tara:strand:- start:18491 stop:21496 length:3006 start_codon:yes stop_codon:yes gene_type:complete